MDATVYIIDDDQAVRHSLAWLLEAESATWRILHFSDAAGFLEHVRAEFPPRSSCLLVDIRLPGMNGLDLLDQLKVYQISIPSIIITGHGDVPAAVRAMKAGAIDFIEKPFDDKTLLRSLNQAMSYARRQGYQLAHQRDLIDRHAELTPREREVMQLVVRGLLNKQIAAELDLSPKTVEVHRAQVMRKMHAESLAELVRMAVELEHAGLPLERRSDAGNRAEAMSN